MDKTNGTQKKNNDEILSAGSNKKGAAERLNVQLTMRELEVLKLTANGQTSAQIANFLFISLSTVESHRRNILRKFNVGNMIEAVAMAIRNGWIE